MKVKDVMGWSGGLWTSRGHELVERLSDADVVVLNGGEDIATSIYHQNSAYGSPTQPSRRDQMEMAVYEQAKSEGKFIFGICRGAQLACAMEGGTLWQHVNNHGTGHPIIDVFTGKTYAATSLHHQMMRPNPKVEHQIIAVANRSTIKVSDKGEVKVDTLNTPLVDGNDPEIIWFPDARALCVQGHPEYSQQSLFADYCFELIDHLRTNRLWSAEAAASAVAV